MRIHCSENIDYRVLQSAANTAGVYIVDLDTRGSRSRARAFNFSLSGSGAMRSQWGNSDHQAATWDEWGIFLAELFKVDPMMHCGKNSYQNAAHFHWMTGDRFRTLTRVDQHKRHKWERAGLSAGGGYSVAECRCGAIQRWVAHGTWQQFVTSTV